MTDTTDQLRELRFALRRHKAKLEDLHHLVTAFKDLGAGKHQVPVTGESLAQGLLTPMLDWYGVALALCDAAFLDKPAAGKARTLIRERKAECEALISAAMPQAQAGITVDRLELMTHHLVRHLEATGKLIHSTESNLAAIEAAAITH
jgi:hypothetical protein